MKIKDHNKKSVPSIDLYWDYCNCSTPCCSHRSPESAVCNRDGNCKAAQIQQLSLTLCAKILKFTYKC